MYSRCHLPHSTRVVPESTPSWESRDVVWPDLTGISAADRVEQARWPTSSGMPPDLAIAGGANKLVTNISSGIAPGNNTASDSRSATQPAIADSSESNHLEGTSANPVFNFETRPTATGAPKMPGIVSSNDLEGTEPKLTSADRDLDPRGIVLGKSTPLNLLGEGRHGRVHVVKVLRCGESVKQRNLELSKETEVPKDYRVALKKITWKGAQCVCSDCDTLNKLRRRKGLATCLSFLPHHFLQCKASNIFIAELDALKRLINIPGTQQFIAQGWYKAMMYGKIVSKYLLLSFVAFRSRTCPNLRGLTPFPMPLARLEGEPLDKALEKYPTSFASKHPGRSPVRRGRFGRCAHPLPSFVVSRCCFSHLHLDNASRLEHAF